MLSLIFTEGRVATLLTWLCFFIFLFLFSWKTFEKTPFQICRNRLEDDIKMDPVEHSIAFPSLKWNASVLVNILYLMLYSLLGIFCWFSLSPSKF
jgi:hypothetical protein